MPPFLLQILRILSLVWLVCIVSTAQATSVNVKQSIINVLPHFEWKITDQQTQLSDIKSRTDWQQSIPSPSAINDHVLWGRVSLNFDSMLRVNLKT